MASPDHFGASYHCEVRLMELDGAVGGADLVAAPAREFVAGLAFESARGYGEAGWTSRDPHWTSQNSEGALDLRGEAAVHMDSYGHLRLSFVRDDGVSVESVTEFAPGSASVQGELRFRESAERGWRLRLECLAD